MKQENSKGRRTERKTNKGSCIEELLPKYRGSAEIDTLYAAKSVAMMGNREGQKAMFSYAVDLERRVWATNPLRAVMEQIDFRWVREEVKDC